ncbi:MAG: hypothetical protein CRN43_03675 [Candidatus Nephrothrix sp. EaCA]|nr:MAG: hypothetical protein CRN43_03675 [Candidatus Nephrothrix sp. EaCA]
MSRGIAFLGVAEMRGGLNSQMRLGGIGLFNGLKMSWEYVKIKSFPAKLIYSRVIRRFFTSPAGCHISRRALNFEHRHAVVFLNCRLRLLGGVRNARRA